MVMITLYVRLQKRHRCIEQTFGPCGRGRGWDDLREGIETCILSYVKQIISPGSMHETGCLGLVHCNDPGRWDGEVGASWVSIGNTCTPMADSCECMAKKKNTTIL